MLLAVARSFAYDAGAIGCSVAPANLSIIGGVCRGTTKVALFTTGGQTKASAQGGNTGNVISVSNESVTLRSRSHPRSLLAASHHGRRGRSTVPPHGAVVGPFYPLPVTGARPNPSERTLR